jgi:palmitoyl transferase
MQPFLKRQHLAVCCTAVFLSSAWADAPQADETAGWYDRAKASLKRTWKDGTAELYLPLYSWHLPWAYTQEQVDNYNTYPLGLGIGRGRYDEDGDSHAFYVIGFQDSHSKPEYQLGYIYKTYWPISGDLKAGLGYTVFLGARSDWNNYMPFPGILPVASLEYSKVSLDATYVPGGDGNGNILFIWARARF